MTTENFGDELQFLKVHLVLMDLKFLTVKLLTLFVFVYPLLTSTFKGKSQSKIAKII